MREDHGADAQRGRRVDQVGQRWLDGVLGGRHRGGGSNTLLLPMGHVRYFERSHLALVAKV
jgi:hypothetical protein